MATHLRKEVIPFIHLMSVAVGRQVECVIREDNNQVLSAARKGYSPALRHLARTERVSLGFVHDVFHGPDRVRGLNIVREDSADQKADFFTKRLPRPQFVQWRDQLGLFPCAMLPDHGD